MATKSVTRTSPAWGIEKWYWDNVTQADVGAAVEGGGKRQRGAVQMTGTFTTATCVLQGSNDGTNYVTVNDVYGNAVSFTAAGAAEIENHFLQYRPSGSGTTLDADVTIIWRDA